jgi:hypothetical protein
LLEFFPKIELSLTAMNEIGSLYSACLRIIQTMDANELRIVLVIAGALVLAAIYWFGRPKRVEAGRREPKMPWAESGGAALSEQFFVAQNDPDAEAVRRTQSARI